jgi:hypothetical protein
MWSGNRGRSRALAALLRLADGVDRRALFEKIFGADLQIA